MICRTLAIIFLVLSSVIDVKGQFTELIQEWPSNSYYFPSDAEFDDEGNYYIGGATNVAPLLIKMSQDGSVLWERTYSFPANHEVVFQKITTDTNGNVFAFGCDSYYPNDGNFIMKIDSDGNEVWRATQLAGYYQYASPKNQLLVDGNNLFLTNVIDDYLILEKYNSVTGNHLLSDTIIDQDTSNISSLNNFNFSHALETETGWICSDVDYIAEIDTSGSIQFTVLGDSLPGQLMGSIDNQYYSFQNISKGKLGYFPLFETAVHTFDIDWSFNQSYDLFDENMLSLSDSMRQLNSVGLTSNEFGTVLSGSYSWRDGQGNGQPNYNSYYFLQVDQRTGNTIQSELYNSGIFNAVDISQYDSAIYVLGSNSIPGFGTSVYKINAPTLPPLSVDQSKSAESFSVYPNPSNSYFNLKSNKRIKQVSVYDLRGSLIMQKPINSKKSRIQLENTGVYLMRIEDVDGNITTKKVVKW
jgi:hypothetical protein